MLHLIEDLKVRWTAAKYVSSSAESRPQTKPTCYVPESARSGQMNRRFVSKVLVFPKIKMQLKRRRFEDFTEIRAHLQAVLDSIVEWEFVKCFQLWDRNRCARYVNSEGGYFDGNVRPNLLYI